MSLRQEFKYPCDKYGSNLWGLEERVWGYGKKAKDVIHHIVHIRSPWLEAFCDLNKEVIESEGLFDIAEPKKMNTPLMLAMQHYNKERVVFSLGRTESDYEYEPIPEGRDDAIIKYLIEHTNNFTQCNIYNQNVLDILIEKKYGVSFKYNPLGIRTADVPE